MVDKEFCMNSYLMYRYIYDPNKSFTEKLTPNIADMNFERKPIKTSSDLLKYFKTTIEKECSTNKVALALSGGIDSAILAKFMPKGSKAVTFNCIVPGKTVENEVERAKYWAKKCELDHQVIDIYWKDIEDVIDKLMLHKGAPVHSIEAQIYIAAQKMKDAGYEKFIFGENADIIYGGMNGLLAKDWLFSEFVDRYSYIMPYWVLKNPNILLDPFNEFEKDGHIDGHDFINKYFRQESLGSYLNACETANIKFVGPYSQTYLDEPIDYSKIRSGDTKYVIREAFNELYPNEIIPKKTPMPRPVNEWFENWEGPKRPEFIAHCTDNMSGNQKWMVWCLERFLNLIEKTEL